MRPFTHVLAATSVAILLSDVLAHAHHNSAPLYDASASTTIEGIVTEVRFVNPHARIYLDVADESGTNQRWMAEGASASALRHRGWTGDEIIAGDRITISGAPARDGSRRVEWRTITLSDGTRLGGGNGFPEERRELLERLERERRESRGKE